MELVAALAVGIGLGAITGMPLGVINVAIVDAAIARERTHARGLALGGALADATHTLLAFAGLGRLVTGRPTLTRYLAITAALVIVVFAIASWRRRRASQRDVRANDSAAHHAASTHDATSTRDRASTRDVRPPDPSLARAIVSGIALTLPNPAALAAWVAVAAMIWPTASLAVAIAIAIGVGLGSAAWFCALGYLVAKVRPDHRALRVIPKVALVVFVAIAIAGVIRAL